MKILIVGGGSIGYITAEYFMNGGHDVTVVESDMARVKLIQHQLDVNVVVGRGTDFKILKDADIDNTKLFLALTDEDEVNIIACVFAKSAGVPMKLARLNETIHLPKESIQALREVGVDEIVDTEQSLIHEIAKITMMPGTTDVKHFMDREFVVAVFSFSRTSPFYGKKLKDIKIPVPFVPIGFKKINGFQAYDEETIINEYVYIYVGCEEKYLKKLHKAFLPESKPVKHVMIFGSGYKNRDTNIALAKLLGEKGIKDIKLVLDNKQEAGALSADTDFPVFFGDPSNPLFAKREQIENEDMFIAISDNFEKNLFSCAMAYNENVPYTISLVRHPEHVNFVSAVPLTAFMNPAMVTANKIMKYGLIEDVVSRNIINYNQIECLEFVVREKSRLIDKKLSDLPIKISRVIAIRRDQEFLEINNTTVLKERDHVLVYLINKEIEKIKKMVI